MAHGFMDGCRYRVEVPVIQSMCDMATSLNERRRRAANDERCQSLTAVHTLHVIAVNFSLVEDSDVSRTLGALIA